MAPQYLAVRDSEVLARSLRADAVSPFLFPALLFNLDIQSLDFLVQCGQRYAEALGRFRLVPATLFEHVNDDLALAFLDQFKQRCVGSGLDEWDYSAAPDNVIGKEFRPNVGG